MIYKIYLITDCHNKNYVGVTKLTLKRRLQLHKRDAKKKSCRSYKLNLDDCKIELLEECNKENRFERESYWINNIDCVNHVKYNFDKKKWSKKNNKLTCHKYYDTKNKKRRYRASFGGDERYNNNLLLIDIDL